MNILFVCDPPVGKADQNVGGTHGVIGNLRDEMEKLGHGVTVVSAELFGQVPSNMSAYGYLCQVLDSIDFDMVHLVTQGKLALMARRYCKVRNIPFTTAYHTQIPEYLEVRHGIPSSIGYAYMRWFLNGAERVIVPTPHMANRLAKRGVKNVVPCLHGVNVDRFKPGDKAFLDLPRPIWLYVGRVTEEKNTEAFCRLNLPGTKLVVGDGYMRPALQQQFPEVVFAGVQTGDALAQYYAAADVFVFPSLTDTFGLVLLEALAAGVPVAAFPVTGPIDVITDPEVGCLDDDLEKAALNALNLSPQRCREFALQNSWTEATARFLDLQTVVPPRRVRKPSRIGAWLDRNLFSSPQMVLASVVGRTESLLFSAEPAGPYAGKNKA